MCVGVCVAAHNGREDISQNHSFACSGCSYVDPSRNGLGSLALTPVGVNRAVVVCALTGTMPSMLLLCMCVCLYVQTPVACKRCRNCNYQFQKKPKIVPRPMTACRKPGPRCESFAPFWGNTIVTVGACVCRGGIVLLSHDALECV